MADEQDDDGLLQLRAPNGGMIVGVVETGLSFTRINGFERAQNGELIVNEYGDRIGDDDWEVQTDKRRGYRLVDEGNGLWWEDECTPVPAAVAAAESAIAEQRREIAATEALLARLRARLVDLEAEQGAREATTNA